MKSRFSFPLRETPQNKALLDSIRKEAEALLSQPIEHLSYGSFILFDQQGSRGEYENEYMLHRKMLAAFSAMALLDEDEKWLAALCNIIWAVCDEFAWALPAHLSAQKTVREKIERIDLFASETAFGLSELLTIFGDKLPSLLRERVVYELERRILTPYLRDFPAFPKNNWSAVCIAGVIATLAFLDRRSDFERAKEHICKTMDVFLASYPDDGCCLEGMLYWNYGFGFFCYAAELLDRYTDGEINYFASEKVKRIAYFGQNLYFRKNHVVSFSDSPHDFRHSTGFWSLLSERFEGMLPPDAEYQGLFGDDPRYRMPPFLRDLYANPLDSSNRNDTRTVYYEEAQWYIHKGFDYVFAAKGGCNAEAHNHNDVGSFEVYDDGSYILDDVGWPMYYKGYFGEHRYSDLCASSRGHSVPIIDGCEQLPGAEYRADLAEQSERGFRISYVSAYGESACSSLVRTFRLSEGRIEIEDVAEGTHESLTERFVTRIPPEVTESGVKIRSWMLSTDAEADVSVSTFTFKPRFAEFEEGTKDLETAYCIDFALKDPKGAVFTLTKE